MDERAPCRIPGTTKGAPLLLLHQTSLPARFEKGAATGNGTEDAKADGEGIGIDFLGGHTLHRPSVAWLRITSKVAFLAKAAATARR